MRYNSYDFAKAQLLNQFMAVCVIRSPVFVYGDKDHVMCHVMQVAICCCVRDYGNYGLGIQKSPVLTEMSRQSI